MEIFYKVEELPEKIQVAWQKKRKLSGQFILSFKSLLKPNATIPILWFTLLTDGIIFLNTHKRQSIYREISKSEINSFRIVPVSSTTNAIEVIFNDIYEPNFVIPVSNGIDLSFLENYL